MAGMELTHAQLTLYPHSVETYRGLLHRTCHGLLHRSGKLRATSEIYTGKLYTPTSLHSSK
jgi:hypothetical protein